MKKYITVLWLFFVLLISAQVENNQNIAGFRGSRILSSYPNNQFPNPNYWANAGEFISNKFSNVSPAAIWIVSLYLSGGYTQLNFPNPGGNYPYVYFIGSDYNESYLTLFDLKGIKVWLQVEPGAANIDTLIHIVLNKYKHHSCIAGFGIDVEWYNTQSNSGGQKVTDIEAKRWEKKVKSIDSNYTLFLKHYGQNWMPPTYRGDILFVDDSQDFTSLSAMVSEFKAWGNKFKPNKVAFQFGYPIDKPWWSKLNDPIKTIGNSLFTNITNCYGVFWVDFTINDVYPITSIKSDEQTSPSQFSVSQNYPNPFNPSTRFSVYVPESGFLACEIYDLTGRKVGSVFRNRLNEGLHNFEWTAETLSSGIYLLKVNFTDDQNKIYTYINKMCLVK